VGVVSATEGRLATPLRRMWGGKRVKKSHDVVVERTPFFRGFSGWNTFCLLSEKGPQLAGLLFSFGNQKKNSEKMR